MKSNHQFITRLGVSCAIGGVLFAISLWTMVSVKDFPPGVRHFFEANEYILRILFFGSQVGFMSGLYVLFITNATGRSSISKGILAIPFLGQLCYMATALLPNQTAMTLLPIPLPQVGAILNALGMVLVGVAVLRAGIWPGWPRLLPLLTGLYPFLVMFPVLAITGHPPRILIGMWGMVWAFFGYGIHAGHAKPVSTKMPV